uniref:DUF5050 domain-containing protein n=1 Tax=Branchiostoma floridae TaxID=7739 RepID=C3XUS7_BRAFL|eukprot:XP_002612143.1 hypothetical protein BRAFLDRAFT_88882 [Branchiostoma floridae]
MYPGGASGRSHCSCLAVGIAVLLSMCALGLAPLTFINKKGVTQLSTKVDILERNQANIRQLTAIVNDLKIDQDDITQLSATVDALERNQDDMRQLSVTVDALKRDQNDMSTIVDAFKRDHDDMRQLSATVDALSHVQDHMSTAFDALKRDQNDMSTTVDALNSDQDDMRQLYDTVDALKHVQDHMSTTVDALKRDQDDMRQLSVTVDALKRDQDDMRQLSATVDALKRDQDDMRQLSATVDALKRDQDDLRQLSVTVDALKRDQDHMRQMSATVDALKRDQYDMRQLSATVDALKRNQDALKRDQEDMRQMSTTVEALKRDQDDMRQLSTTVDALKRDQDNMHQLSTAVDALMRNQDNITQLSATVDALKRDQVDMRQLSTAVDALMRNQDNITQVSATVDVLKSDQDDMRQLSTAVDALKRDMDKERNRTAALEQRLDETCKTPGDRDSRENSEPFLLVADRDEETIFQVDITSGSKVTLPLVGVGMPVALDYDPLTDYVYWSDKRNKEIKRARRDGSGMETIIDTGYDAYGLALDHAEGDIYWSVYSAKTISVAKTDGSSSRTLLMSPDIEMTYSLVLDPRNRLMYWVDHSKRSIHRAEMGGSGQTTIVTGLEYPCCITIDFNEDRLYYRDGYGMYSSDLLGKDIRQVLYEDGKLVNGIAVDEDFVYWSSIWRDSSSSSSSWHGKIGKLSKSNLTKTVLVDSLKYPHGIYLSTAAPPGVNNETSLENLNPEKYEVLPPMLTLNLRKVLNQLRGIHRTTGHARHSGQVIGNLTVRSYCENLLQNDMVAAKLQHSIAFNSATKMTALPCREGNRPPATSGDRVCQIRCGVNAAATPTTGRQRLPGQPHDDCRRSLYTSRVIQSGELTTPTAERRVSCQPCDSHVRKERGRFSFLSSTLKSRARVPIDLYTPSTYM